MIIVICWLSVFGWLKLVPAVRKQMQVMKKMSQQIWTRLSMRLCNTCTAMLMTSSPLGSLQMNWEDELVPKYLTSGCGYMKARGAQCCQQFSQEYVTLVCQKMLHFLRSIRIKRFKNLKASSKDNGLSPCVHGKSRKLPHNTFFLSST